MNKMLELVEWLADYAEIEVKDIQDIGKLSYRLRGLIQFKDADRIDEWKERMDQCVINEFTEPQKLLGYRFIGKKGETIEEGIADDRGHWVFTDEHGFTYYEEEA